MDLTLSDIENLSKSNEAYSLQLQLLYDSINDFPSLDLDSISELKKELEKQGLKSFDVKDLQEFQQSLSVSKSAWVIESLENLLVFCDKVEENNFERAILKLRQKLRVA